MAVKSNLISRTLAIVISICCLSPLSAQDSKSIIQDYLNQYSSELKIQAADVSEWLISKEYYSKSTDITHVYIKQTLHGLELVNGSANFNLRNGEVFSMGNRLVSNISRKSNSPIPSLSSAEAIYEACEQLGLNRPSSLSIIETVDTHEFLFDKTGISLEDIPVKLVYQHTEKDLVRLSWDLSINTLDGQNWWSVRVDAETGEIISKHNWTTHCNFGSCAHDGHRSADASLNTTDTSSMEVSSNPPVAGAYNVFAIPTESPAHGPRTLVFDPEDLNASPFGWHDDDGIPGIDYTITRGNNVHAYEDRQDNNQAGDSPDGGAALNFDYSYNINQPALDNLDAAITNLFYMNNIMHDVWYQYGFDEASGNFQQENYLNAGGVGNDYVRAEGLDGSGLSNANFSTPVDGARPRMQMYIWTDGAEASNFSVNSPPSDAALDIAYINSTAGFGGDIPILPLTADLVLVSDDSGTDVNDACEDIINVDSIPGKIAVIRRGQCEFGFKVLAAEEAGAVAVLIVNNVGGDPVPMGAGALGNQVTIPSIMLSSAQGEAIISALENGDLVNGTLGDDSGSLVAFDSDFDNGIIAHEYGHGISIRLTGGANNSGCLSNDEQMGEGWSDWFGIMLTMQEDDLPEDPRGVGTYVIGQPNNGNGIRPAPYSTSTAVNSFTYGNTNNQSQTSMPHGIGFVWATMLWDLNWALIDQYGFDPDVYYGSGGNNIAMQLVIDGLKLQPCSPGFVDGRDAILEADMLNYDGLHQCLIWEVFANRGLGYSASQGSPNSRFDQTQAFDLPPLEVTVAVESNTLTAENSNAGVSYQWIDCSDDSEIPGETDQTFSPQEAGEYAVMIDQNGCTASSECVSITELVGIEELIQANVTISPNPASTFLTVEFGALDDIQTLELMDVQGKQVYSETSFSSQLLRIDLSDIQSGVYLMNVVTERGSSVFKVMVD